MPVFLDSVIPYVGGLIFILNAVAIYYIYKLITSADMINDRREISKTVIFGISIVITLVCMFNTAETGVTRQAGLYGIITYPILYMIYLFVDIGMSIGEENE